MKVGYVRCSTVEQNEARQLKMMEEQGVERIFTDKASGKNTDRGAFQEMMAFIREKFWSVLRKGMSEPSERMTSTASSPGSSRK